MRSTGAALALAVALAVTQPWRLRVRRNELLFLVAFGIFGLALVQWFYFFAIHRLQIGIALLIQYLAPVLIALWARSVMKEPVRRRIWVALILSLGGLSLVVDLRHGISLDALGVAASLGGGGHLRALHPPRRARSRAQGPGLAPLSRLRAAAVFWAVVQPWWSFPTGIVDDRVTLDGALFSTTTPVWGCC